MTKTQIAMYEKDGYVKVEGLFTEKEVEELQTEMDWIIEEWWGENSIGWRGPWRAHYLLEEERQNTKAIFISNPHFYSAAWGRIIFHAHLAWCNSITNWQKCTVASYNSPWKAS